MSEHMTEQKHCQRHPDQGVRMVEMVETRRDGTRRTESVPLGCVECLKDQKPLGRNY